MTAVIVTEAQLRQNFIWCQENLIQSVVIVSLPKNHVHHQAKLREKYAPCDHGEQPAENGFFFVTDARILFLTALVLTGELTLDAHRLFVFNTLYRVAKSVSEAAWALLSKYVLCFQTFLKIDAERLCERVTASNEL